MEILPAIDLIDAQVVRLTQGDYDQVEVYSQKPWEIASEFYRAGAKHLHIVDLDGAKDGKLSNFAAIEKILASTLLEVEVGGGIRDEDRIRRYLNIGVSRVILGTVAAEDPDFVRRMVALYGGAIAVGVDARDQKVAVKGWREVTDLDSLEFCKEVAAAGVGTIIYTDISKDGMMAGIDSALYQRLAAELPCKIIASGGVSRREDIKTLNQTGVWGAIVGKALYTGALQLQEVLAWCGQNG